MQKNFLCLLVICLLFCLAACDDDASVNKNVTLSTIPAGVALGECTAVNDGAMAYVTDSANVYYCVAGAWQTLDGEDGINGKDGLNGINGVNGADGEDASNSNSSDVVNEFIYLKDTTVLCNYDTIYHIDSLSQVDSVFVLDTLNLVDTIILNKRDTVFLRDTVVGFNGADCFATDTVNAEGLAGINIDCGNIRSGTIWNSDGGDGKSAYEIAVENGFTGSEEEWLDSLRPLSSASAVPPISYGELIDTRDNQIYKTVVIGTLTWMAQNLNYAYLQKTSTLDSSSFCYNNSVDSCAKYGRLYLWSAAVDSAAEFSENGKDCGYGTPLPKQPTRGICPEGWHLPSYSEARALRLAVGITGTTVSSTRLKSTSGWDSNADGTDAYGFSALPAGVYESVKNSYLNIHQQAMFWASSAYSSDIENADCLDITYNSRYVGIGTCARYYGYSVRCVKDSGSVK